MKVAVVSPHRDDVAFSLALGVDVWITSGHSVEVINCFTRSEFAPFSDVSSIHPNDRASYVTALRTREDDLWRRVYGQRLTFSDLHLEDAPLRLFCSPDAVCDREIASNDKALLKIERVLDSIDHDVLVAPLALGRHIDHVSAQTAAVIVAGRTSQRPCAFYEDLPYAARPGVAGQIEAAAHSLRLDLQPVLIGNTAGIREAAVRKRGSALCYDSQIDDDVVEDIAAFCARYNGRERLWANAAWRTTPGLLGGVPNEARVH